MGLLSTLAVLAAVTAPACAWLRPAPEQAPQEQVAEPALVVAAPAVAAPAEAPPVPPAVVPAIIVPAVDAPTDDPVVVNWCKTLGAEIRRIGWELDPCPRDRSGRIYWKVGGTSVQGRPLMFAEFGHATGENTTLFIGMVHGDEGTPLYLGLRLAHWLSTHQNSFPSTRVVVAPLANPDGFFRTPKTRVNARGVDVNRNFLTQDWDKRALHAWKTEFRSNPRRFPGQEPGSEPETVFQADLIERYSPRKIVSAHAPLNFMDYDGPSTVSLERFPEDYVRKCLELRSELNAVEGGYFPGSLGNYAGRERGIPTFTLELPSANPKLAAKYWDRFRTGIQTVIVFKVPQYADAQPTPVSAGYP